MKKISLVVFVVFVLSALLSGFSPATAVSQATGTVTKTPKPTRTPTMVPTARLADTLQLNKKVSSFSHFPKTSQGVTREFVIDVTEDLDTILARICGDDSITSLILRRVDGSEKQLLGHLNMVAFPSEGTGDIDLDASLENRGAAKGEILAQSGNQIALELKKGDKLVLLVKDSNGMNIGFFAMFRPWVPANIDLFTVDEDGDKITS